MNPDIGSFPHTPAGGEHCNILTLCWSYDINLLGNNLINPFSIKEVLVLVLTWSLIWSQMFLPAPKWLHFFFAGPGVRTAYGKETTRLHGEFKKT